jgi:ABC-type transport system involved in multi-copper enzyme maturation permease subunit
MLLWKEWKENLWKLCFCGLASVVFTAMLFRIRIIPDLANCVLISFIQVFTIPLIYSLDIFSGEISNRTVHLLFKIPVRRWMLFFSKYLISVLGIVLIFLITSVLMEFMARGREAQVLYLMKINSLYGTAALILFTWFCAFGCQSRSEAGSLVIMFSIFIGWGIVLLWSSLCDVAWVERFVPYSLMLMEFPKIVPVEMIFSQLPVFAAVLGIACYRYASIRRYL